MISNDNASVPVGKESDISDFGPWSNPIELSSLATRYGSDKASKCGVYERYFNPIRHKELNFLEIGIGGYDDPKAGGGSLRMWKHYFPKAQIFGIDYYDKSVHEEARVKIFRGSQDDSGFLNIVAKAIGRIDVILDDGSHISAHIIKSFETLFPLLGDGGLYIVEDIGTSYWPDYGGSPDFLNPDTSMFYFKRLADGLNHFAFKHEFVPTYYDQHTEFIHFYKNFLILKKTP
jgi:hypothetical protein